MPATTIRLVVIGTSTGGPQALTELFRSLPTGLPVCFAVALHIPAGYTAPLAARLSGLGGMKIVEASDGMEIPVGSGVIAPGGRQLTIQEKNGRLFACVSDEPSDTLHRPSVDVLFASAARMGSAALGVVLTGMGNDGTAGAGEMSRAGGVILTESASSCVVYGMPRSVVEAKLSSAEAPLEGVAGLILRMLSEHRVKTDRDLASSG